MYRSDRNDRSNGFNRMYRSDRYNGDDRRNG